MRPIVIAATGGVGNQLFQFAAARAIARATGRAVEVCYRRSDQTRARRAFLAARSWIRGLGADADRRYELARLARGPDLLRIQSEARETTPEEDRAAGRSRGSLKQASRGRPLPGARVLVEPDEVSAVIADPTSVPPDRFIVVAGILAVDRFVAPQLESLRAAIRLPAESEYARRWLERIRSMGPVVGVHVRRGDYLKPKFADTIHLLRPSWYARGAEILRERHGGLSFVVVSDEPAWCRANLRLPGPTHLASGEHPTDPLDDLAILAACRHHLVANSTFSWWGARLAAEGGSQVVPRHWMKGSLLHPEILPQSWTVLDNEATRG